MARKIKTNTYEKINGERGFYKDPCSNIIYFIKSIDGKIIKFSCKTDSITTAKRYASKKLKEKLGTTKKFVTPLLGYWIDKYIKHRESDESLSDSPIRNSRVALIQAKPFFKDKLPSEIDRDLWIEFCTWYKSEYSNQLENVHKYFRNFLNWLAEEKHNNNRVLIHVPKIKNPDARKDKKERKKKKDRVLTKEEFRKIFEAGNEDEKLLVLLMYTMAFRVESDALSSKWSQFKLEKDIPIYTFGEFDNKAGLEGSQAIHSEVLKLLKERKSKSKSVYLFPQKIDNNKHMTRGMINWESYRKRSGVKNWTAHTFRHSCLTQLAENNYPTHLICKCYRISYQEFVATYAHLTTEGLLKMQDAVEVKI